MANKFKERGNNIKIPDLQDVVVTDIKVLEGGTVIYYVECLCGHINVPIVVQKCVKSMIIKNSENQTFKEV